MELGRNLNPPPGLPAQGSTMDGEDGCSARLAGNSKYPSGALLSASLAWAVAASPYRSGVTQIFPLAPGRMLPSFEIELAASCVV
jgi:hypothetical protein